jgi:hypothetical protein
VQFNLVGQGLPLWHETSSDNQLDLLDDLQNWRISGVDPQNTLRFN